jgi:hypothetical protein
MGSLGCPEMPAIVLIPECNYIGTPLFLTVILFFSRI